MRQVFLLALPFLCLHPSLPPMRRRHRHTVLSVHDGAIHHLSITTCSNILDARFWRRKCGRCCKQAIVAPHGSNNTGAALPSGQHDDVWPREPARTRSVLLAINVSFQKWRAPKLLPLMKTRMSKLPPNDVIGDASDSLYLCSKVCGGASQTACCGATCEPPSGATNDALLQLIDDGTVKKKGESSM